MKDTQIKLVTITRDDLKPGYQIPQSLHALAEFAYEFPELFKDWKETSNYVISLSADNEEKLNFIYHKLKARNAHVVRFSEPDIGNQLTSVCYYGTPEMRKVTNKLNLALKNS